MIVAVGMHKPSGEKWNVKSTKSISILSIFLNSKNYCSAINSNLTSVNTSFAMLYKALVHFHVERIIFPFYLLNFFCRLSYYSKVKMEHRHESQSRNETDQNKNCDWACESSMSTANGTVCDSVENMNRTNRLDLGK